jgi:hypothetical protein
MNIHTRKKAPNTISDGTLLEKVADEEQLGVWVGGSDRFEQVPIIRLVDLPNAPDNWATLISDFHNLKRHGGRYPRLHKLSVHSVPKCLWFAARVSGQKVLT